MGLAQREIEAAGISTVSLSVLPEVTCSVCTPRVAGIAYPLGRPLGRPGDVEGQREVLRDALAVLEQASGPGELVRLPFSWPEPLRRAHGHPPEPPPIARLVARKPWLLGRLLQADFPDRT